MLRKITQKLLGWKESSTRKPLVLTGARQVGKTYSVNDFGARHYDEYLHIDFAAERRYCDVFEKDITPGALIPLLETLSRVRIDPDRTLIFFDEVQACPRALESLKYFQERAPEYHVIAAGSLLGISLAREGASFPVGKVDLLDMFPMDFEEFLWATGEDRLSDAIREYFASDSSFALHDIALDHHTSYLVVGGMPEVVGRFATTRSYEETRALQYQISTGYIADMVKHADASESARILDVWRSIPEQFAKQNHKFQYSTISSAARAHQYESAIRWLESAGLVMKCTRVSEGRKPLSAFVEHDAFKLYVTDIGLLTSALGLAVEDLLARPAEGKEIRGGVMENYVMQQLVAAGVAPHYWGTASRSEVDFIIEDAKRDPIPIEVKSGRNVISPSLRAYIKSYDPNYAIRISRKNFGFEGDVRSVPLYAAFCLDGI